jgi:hypothetical protein
VANNIDKKKEKINVPADGKNPYAEYAASMNRRPFKGDLLKFDKGDYLAGQEEREIPLGTRFKVAMDYLLVGWVKWKDRTAVVHDMGLLIEGFVAKERSELGDTDQSQWPIGSDGKPIDPWAFTNYLPMIGDEDEEVYTFTTSSKGGINCIGLLCETYGKKFPPDKDPIIEVQMSSYPHPEFGRVKYPVFKVVGETDKIVLD